MAIDGGGTTSVTPTLSGLFVALEAAIGTFAVYDPVASEPTLACNVNAAGVDVLESDAVSQPFAAPLYSIAPTVSAGMTLPLTLTTFTICAPGLAVPPGAVNETVVGFAPSVIAAPIANVTLKLLGDAPGLVDVTGTEAV